MDLSGLTQLQTLDCSSNWTLTSLDLTGLTQLQTLKCEANYSLVSLDVSNCNQLKNLNCAGNYQLQSLDVGSLTLLESLNCTDCNNLGNLDLTNLTNLQYLNCTSCYGIESLNLSGLVSLRELICVDNFMIASLDLSQSTQLQNLNCGSMANLSSLNVANLNQLTPLNCALCPILSALDLTGLSSLQTVDCTYCNLSNLVLTGANAIVNLYCGNNLALGPINVSNLLQLQKLDVSKTLMPTINLAGLTNLKTLTCQSSGMTSLNINELINLTYLDCSDNLLTALNISALSDLETLNCSLNQLSILEVANLLDLKDLSCYSNNLTVLNTTPLTLLESLNCSDNQLTTIDLSQLINLKQTDCSNNLFTTLDFSHMYTYNTTAINSIYFINNPNLTNVNLKNGFNVIDSWLLPGSFSGGCPNLRYVCADLFNIQTILYRLQNEGNTNVLVNEYCSFSPGGIYNNITGTQSYDVNNNGCDAADYHFPLMKVTIDDGTENGATYTNETGNYSFYTQAGSFVITPLFENPYFTILPPSATINFASLDGSTQAQDFCIAALGIHYDVEIALIPVWGAGPGFDWRYRLVYKNKGNQILSGSIDLTFNDAVLDFVSAAPNTDSQSLNHLEWNYTSLYPFESREIELTLNLNSPMETPAVNIGDVLNFTTTIDPIAGDETMADNTFPLMQIVVGSFDPNDKTCLQGNTITTEMVGKYLHYLIRFQNSGTAAAQNVVIKDVIDTTKFDMASLQLTSSSHPQVTKIMDNKVEFQFENINLPAEIDDAPGSNGYVAFKIKTKSNLVIGDAVSNKADIFFDYNFPIETNTATTTVALLGVNQVENKSVSIAPNPTKNKIHITSQGNITSVLFFDVQGRILETMTTNDESVDFDLSLKQSGIYFVKVYTAKGVKVEKVIKE